MAQAIFGLAPHLIQKNLNIKKKYFEKFEAKNGVKIEFAVWGEEVLRWKGWKFQLTVAILTLRSPTPPLKEHLVGNFAGPRENLPGQW